MKEKNNKLAAIPRPPVVVILGHVDHGKTSILDYIRQSKVAESESGGITQHIGAYQIEMGNPPSSRQGETTEGQRKITFIDTPGHEMFAAMRKRGAKIADIAVLVVAAEEGVKLQTKEAIKHIKEAKLPFIVAINKIDKREAQPEKTKSGLADNGVEVESLGGKIPSVNISAKTGQGIDELLEMIILVAEMEELSATTDKPAQGVIIEANCSTKRGVITSILVKDGILKSTDVIGTDSAFGKIKIMEDFKGKGVKEASASMPVVVSGFNRAPKLGEDFRVFSNLKEAESHTKIVPPILPQRKEKNALTDKKMINLLLKADVSGCLEALGEAIANIQSEEVGLKIIKAEVGEISESDIKLAQSTDAKIIGFKVKANPLIKRMAQQKKVKILVFDIVYELIQAVRELMTKILSPEIVVTTIGQVKVLALFRNEKDRQIVGGKVISGQAKQGGLIKVIREGKEVGQGKTIQLQRGQKEIDEVNKDQECGILFKGNTTIEEKDILEFYVEERKKKELS